jgi:nitrogen PTS system EIIA component
MKLSDILDEQNIIPQLKAKDKKGVLEELAEAVLSNLPSLDKNSLVRVLLERERLGSTGIGDGVAIPHGKFPGLIQPMISFGRSLEGLDFDSMDGQPAHLFFLLVAPENSASVHLKALAKIAKILKNGAFRKMLIEAPGKPELYQTIIQNDDEF